MGIYIYTYKKKFNKNATLNGEKVVVGEATYLCRADYSNNYTAVENREMIRATKLPKGEQPDFITFDGENVYKNNKFGMWNDGSGFYSGIHWENDLVGKLEKEGKKYVVKNLTKVLVD